MDPRQFLRIGLLVTAANLMAGCATGGFVRLDDPTALEGPADLKPLPLTMPKDEAALLGQREVDWGLALSGGGLRSALFSFGVTKALFDRGILDKVDIISTVSGGGYTGYWLYANEFAEPRARFGEFSLSDENFPKRMCELETTGNFVTYPQITRIISPALSKWAVELYERSLLRTFGARDPKSDPLTIAGLEPLFRSPRTPLLIQNATIKSAPSGAALPWAEKLIEFTPLGYGSNQLGWLNWNSGPGTTPLTLTKTTAISGAAFAPLDQIAPLRRPASSEMKIAMHDGGKSENLGAIALIRRGVPNVIISDAEHDPGYIFQAYRQLRFGLQQYGLTLTVRSIDNYLLSSRRTPFNKAVAVGTVTRAGSNVPVSTIYYIKANMAEELNEILDEQVDRNGEGAAADRQFRTAMIATRRPGSRDWICDDIKGVSIPTKQWAAWSVASYSRWLRGAWKAKLVRLTSNATGIADMRIEFPQYSTGDQSFANDQSEAFFGLGYLQALAVHSVSND